MAAFPTTIAMTGRAMSRWPTIKVTQIVPDYSAEEKKKERKKATPVVEKCSQFSFSADGQVHLPSIYAANKYV